MNKDLPINHSDTGLLYDLTYLESASVDDKEFIKKLVSMFIEIMPESLHELNEAANIKDIKQVRKSAHKMKSSIELMGIHSLKDTIKTLEFIADDDNSLDVHIDYLNNKMNEVFAQLKELI